MEASNTLQTISCDQPGCQLRSDGVCLEGFKDPKACSHTLHDLAFDDSDDEDEESDEGIDEADDHEDVGKGETSSDVSNAVDELSPPNYSGTISLFSGRAMSEAEMSSITYAYPSKLILIMGEPACGKTTLVAALFDAFQQGPVGDFLFAGSRTQIGFEERCHLARLKSGMSDPDTERTKSSEFSYLHLAVRHNELLKPAQHLIFTDVSGERFKGARDIADDMHRLTILKHADHLFYIVDGKKMSNLSTRYAARSDAFRFIERAKQSEMVTPKNKIYILINKCDEIELANAVEDVETFFTKQLLAKYGDLINGILRIVARPSRSSGSSVARELDSFVSLCATSRAAVVGENLAVHKRTALREFDRLFQS